MRTVLASLLLCLFSFAITAQTGDSPSPIMFIYDASGSMWGQVDGKTKMAIATEVLSSTIGQLPDNQAVGLVAYGHRSKEDCEDIEVLAGFDNFNKEMVNNALGAIKPLGRTPLAASASLVVDQLRDAGLQATVILVTDGIESCGGDICEVIKAARAEGIGIRLHIIGFGLKDDETEQLKCAAGAGGGQYYNADDADGLAAVLQSATEVTIDDPEGNFTVFVTRNGEAIDAIAEAYEPGTSNRVAAVRTYRDTGLVFLPAGLYDLHVRPLENMDVKGLVLEDIRIEGDTTIHRTVSFDAGKFTVMTTNNGAGWDAIVKVYNTSDGKTTASGRTYGEEEIFEVDPGIYDVEVTAMAVEGLEKSHRWEDVKVDPGETVGLLHNFKTGILMIGARSGDTLVDAIVSIVEMNSQKNIDQGRTYTSDSSNPKKFVVSPGSYLVSVKGLADYAGSNAEFTIELEAGATVEKIAEF